MDRRRQTIARLYARLAERFELYDETLPIGPLRVQFTRVADPQKVLDDICRRIDEHEKRTGERVQSDELGLPYWAELWDSAVGIGQWLVANESTALRRPDLENPALSKPARVLDLGCGMGLSGTVAAVMGAEVLFADIERDCLLFSALNGLRYSATARSRRVNWQRDDLGERFDLIIGSDVLYDKTQWPYLNTFFRAHLAPGGQILLGEPGRQSGDLFLPWIATHGWTLRRYVQSVATRTVPIRLFVLSDA